MTITIAAQSLAVLSTHAFLHVHNHAAPPVGFLLAGLVAAATTTTHEKDDDNNTTDIAIEVTATTEELNNTTTISDSTTAVGPATTATTTTQSRFHTFLDTFHQIPPPIRYFVSGNLGNVIFFLLERVLYGSLVWYFQSLPKQHQQGHLSTSTKTAFVAVPHSLPKWVNSVTFFTAYVVHVPAQHYLHALLVYGLESMNTPAKYWATLAATYSALGVSAVGATLVNAALIHAGVHKDWAFVGTMWGFALVNYFVLNWIVRLTSTSADSGAAADQSNADDTGFETTKMESSKDDEHSSSS